MHFGWTYIANIAMGEAFLILNDVFSRIRREFGLDSGSISHLISFFFFRILLFYPLPPRSSQLLRGFDHCQCTRLLFLALDTATIFLGYL